jgi:hypothetical protein
MGFWNNGTRHRVAAKGVSKTDRGRPATSVHGFVLAVFRARAIAVGTAISGRPPHRSVRAELLHTAPTFDVDVRSVLQDTDGGYVGWGAIDCRSS